MERGKMRHNNNAARLWRALVLCIVLFLFWCCQKISHDSTCYWHAADAAAAKFRVWWSESTQTRSDAGRRYEPLGQGRGMRGTRAGQVAGQTGRTGWSPDEFRRQSCRFHGTSRRLTMRRRARKQHSIPFGKFLHCLLPPVREARQK